MAENIINLLKKRQARMEDQRRTADDLYDDINDLLQPVMTPFIDEIQEGEESGSEIFTTDPPRHLRTCSDGMQGFTVSEHIDWFDYEMADRLLQEDDNVRKWLQECKRFMIGRFKSSNFYKVIPPHLRCYLSFGNSAIISEWNWTKKRITYCTPHPKQNYWILDADGEVLVYHRKFRMTAAAMRDKFGEDKLSAKIKAALANGQENEKYDVLMCIMRANDVVLKDYTKAKKPWIQLYIDPNLAQSDTQKPLKEGWFYTCAAAVAMYERETDENYARGIGHLAIADIRGMNEIRASMTVGIQKEIDKPIIAPTDVRGMINSYPNGETYVDPEQVGQIKPLYNSPVNFSAGEMLEDKINQAIKEWFSVDYFLMLNDLVRKGGSPPTATQIVEMAGEKSTLMITRVGLLTTGCLDNLMQRAFLLEYEYNDDFPEPPQIVIDRGGGIPKVNFTGPIFQAQKLSHTVRRMSNAIATVDPIIQRDPMTIHKIRWSKAMEKQLEAQNFDQDLIVPEDEYQQIVQNILQQQQQQQMAEMIAKGAASIPALQKKTEAGSPMDMIAGAA